MDIITTIATTAGTTRTIMAVPGHDCLAIITLGNFTSETANAGKKGMKIVNTGKKGMRIVNTDRH